MEQGDLDLLKDIPGFKAILRAIIKSQMKHLVEQLSKHGGEETVLLTASLAEGSFCNLGSSKAEGFLDGKDEIKSQFLGYCLKSAQKQAQDQDIEKTGDPNTESGSSKNFLSSTTKTQCVGASVLVTEAKNNEKTQEEALPQTKRSEAGSADQEHRRGRPSKKRASVTIIHEKQAKRAALPKTVTPPQKTDRTNREKSHGVSVGSGDTTIIIDAVKVENHSANASLNKDENTDHIINLIPLLTEPLGTSEDKYDTNTEQAGETEWKNKSLDSDEDIPLEIKVEPADDDEIVEIEESTSQFGFDSAAAEGEDTASAGGENTATASRSGGRPTPEVTPNLHETSGHRSFVHGLQDPAAFMLSLEDGHSTLYGQSQSSLQEPVPGHSGITVTPPPMTPPLTNLPLPMNSQTCHACCSIIQQIRADVEDLKRKYKALKTDRNKSREARETHSETDDISGRSRAAIEALLKDEMSLVRAVEQGMQATFSLEELKSSSLKGGEKRKSTPGRKPGLSPNRLKFLTSVISQKFPNADGPEIEGKMRNRLKLIRKQYCSPEGNEMYED